MCIRDRGLMDKAAFAKMKKTCIFLNLGRGPIVVEQDLYAALENDEIAAAGLDVLCQMCIRDRATSEIWSALMRELASALVL